MDFTPFSKAQTGHEQGEEQSPAPGLLNPFGTILQQVLLLSLTVLQVWRSSSELQLCHHSGRAAVANPKLTLLASLSTLQASRKHCFTFSETGNHRTSSTKLKNCII